MGRARGVTREVCVGWFADHGVPVQPVWEPGARHGRRDFGFRAFARFPGPDAYGRVPDVREDARERPGDRSGVELPEELEGGEGARDPVELRQILGRRDRRAFEEVRGALRPEEDRSRRRGRAASAERRSRGVRQRVLRGDFPEDSSRLCFFQRRGGEKVTAGLQTIYAKSVEVAARCSPPTPPDASRRTRQRARDSRRRTRERRAKIARCVVWLLCTLPLK